MKHAIINYMDTIYNIEDNIENVKKYFHFHQLEKEYDMIVEIQMLFRKSIAEKLYSLDHLN